MLVNRFIGLKVIEMKDLHYIVYFSVGDPSAWIEQIPVEKRRRRLEEKDLSKIAQVLGSDWEVVASELGLKTVDIDRCKMDNHTTTMRVYAALYKWRNSVASGATLEALVQVLSGCQCTTIDWPHLERLARNM